MRQRNGRTGVLSAALLLASAISPSINAQSTSTIRGVAYDSLHAQPLGQAIVSILGTARTATTDSAGRFSFDSLPLGTYTFTLLHSVVDSLGLPDLSERIALRNADDTVALAIPAFDTFWRRACGTGTAPTDSGFIFGTVLGPSGAPAMNARVTLSFMAVTLEQNSGARQRRGSGEVQTDAAGAFVICGVPTDLDLQLVAERDSLSTGLLDLPLSREQVRRQDLVLGGKIDNRQLTGRVHGKVLYRETGSPAIGVRVLATGAKEARTSSDGSFTLTGVPTGTRQIEVISVGMQPAARIVEVRQSATAEVGISLDKVTMLDARDITASRSVRATRILDMERRRELGLGKYADSTSVAKQATVQHAIQMMGGGRLCELMYIDGIGQYRRTRDEVIASIDTHSIAVLEIVMYVATPLQWKPRINCDTLVIWTKNGLP